MDTGFDASKDYLLPKQDSAAYLKQLASPDFEGKDLLRGYIVGKMEKRIERTLLNQAGPTINFSDKAYGFPVGDPSITYQRNRIDNNARYRLNDPTRFYEMLDERPQDFSVDCLNIIPITILGATRDALIERGHDQDKIDKLLKGTIIHGDETELSLSFWQRQKLRPFSFEEKDIRDENKQITFSRPKESAAVAGYRDDGIIPNKVFLSTDVSPGDLLYTHSIGVDHFPDVGNQDSQNGIILTQAKARTPGDHIRVFAHRTKTEDRESNVGEVFRMLSDEATKRGMTMDEYFKRGAIRLTLGEFDYAGFYGRLAENLMKQ